MDALMALSVTLEHQHCTEVNADYLVLCCVGTCSCKPCQLVVFKFVEHLLKHSSI